MNESLPPGDWGLVKCHAWVVGGDPPLGDSGGGKSCDEIGWMSSDDAKMGWMGGRTPIHYATLKGNGMKKLNLDAIRLDGDTQPRISLDSQRVFEYSEQMKEGDEFPAIVVFFDGSDHWLSDGFHRWHATKMAGLVSIDAEVRQGTREEAQIYAMKANTRRGLSMSHEDNRRNIIRMLTHTITSSWTLGEIARHLDVSKMTVSRVKATLKAQAKDAPEDPVKSYQRKNGKQVTIDTTNNKTKKAKDVEPPPAPEQVESEPASESDQKIAELIDTINELNAENQRLKDAIATAQWDASEIEKIDVQDTLADLREQIKVLEIDNAALRDSRDMFQNRNAELMKSVKALQSKLKKLETA